MKYNVRVEDKSKDGILFSEMKDGEIGVIISDMYQGRIVQRYDNAAISIGMESGHRWIDVTETTHRVRILQPGDKIIL